MSDEVSCQNYEIDYKKVVEEIQEELYKKIEYCKKPVEISNEKQQKKIFTNK